MEFIDFDAYLLASATAINKSSQCLWRGHASDGKELHCSNRRLVHPTRLVKSPYGADVFDVLLYCNYHSRECIADHAQRKNVLVPNELSYCTECYYLTMHRRPRRLTALTVPGVFVFDETVKRKRKRPTILTYSQVLNENSVCAWRPAEKHMQGFRCSNRVLRDPATKEYIPTCGFHVTRCPRLHVNKKDCIISAPNELGLCPIHFQQETGVPPASVDWPYPGMVKVQVRKFVRCNASHWAAPPWPPRPDVYVDRVESPYESEECDAEDLDEACPLPLNPNETKQQLSAPAAAPMIGSLVRGAPSQKSLRAKKLSKKSRSMKKRGILPLAMFSFRHYFSQCMGNNVNKKRKLLDHNVSQRMMISMRNISLSSRNIRGYFSRGTATNEAATVIQKIWRGYFRRLLHKELFFSAQVKRRIFAATIIQAKIRSLLVRKHLDRILFGFSREALRIQSLVRAFLARRFLKRLRAALRLQAFFRECRKKFLWRGVLLVIDLRIQFRRNDPHSISIQKSFRGFLVRNRIHATGAEKIRCQRSKNIIARFLTKFLIRRRHLKKLEDDRLVLKMRSVMLARRIYPIYLSYKARKTFLQRLDGAVPHLQSQIRGYLTRVVTHKLRVARDNLRNWITPAYSKGFTELFLRKFKAEIIQSKALLLQPSSLQLMSVDTNQSSASLRKFLPQRLQKLDEIEWKLFFTILQKWYKERSYPLLLKEAKSLIDLFKNPDNNNVYVKSAEKFIALHEKPCRKHGRWLCGACNFRGECLTAKCLCQRFVNTRSSKEIGVCANCNHMYQSHRLCPLQLCPTDTKVSMLSILNESRHPDVSIPTEVKGVSTSKALGSAAGRTARLSIDIKPTIQETKLLGYSRTVKNKLQETKGNDNGLDKGLQPCIPLEGLNLSTASPNTKVGRVKFWSNVVRKNPNKVRRCFSSVNIMFNVNGRAKKTILRILTKIYRCRSSIAADCITHSMVSDYIFVYLQGFQSLQPMTSTRITPICFDSSWTILSYSRFIGER